MPYENQHAGRVKEPGLFKTESFRSKDIAPGVRIIMGKLKGSDSMTTQTYRFDSSKFSAEEARKWLKDHNIHILSFEPAESGEMKKAKFIRIQDKIYTISEDVLEKAGKAAIGSTATWADGKTYKKVSESKWEPVEGSGAKVHGYTPNSAGGQVNRGETPDNDKISASQMHEKFRTAIEGMSKEGRDIYRGGKFDFGKRRFESIGGDHFLEYKDGKVHSGRNMKKAIDDWMKDAYSRDNLQEYDPMELEMGINDEMEHTDDPEVAAIIAMQHLDKIPDYYSRSKKAGLIEEDENEPTNELAFLTKAKLYFMAKASPTHKYVKRIPNPKGQGYIYFYTQEQVKQFQKDGTIPKQNDNKNDVDEKDGKTITIIKGALKDIAETLKDAL